MAFQNQSHYRELGARLQSHRPLAALYSDRRPPHRRSAGRHGDPPLKAHAAAVAGLVTALLAAIAIFHMPARLAFTAAAYGAGYGIFPICWIIFPVIFLYHLTVKTGSFVTLQQSLTGITADSRLQVLLIAFALGAFFEGSLRIRHARRRLRRHPHLLSVSALSRPPDCL